jgi:putative endonuclease
MFYYTYILLSKKDGLFYIGFTSNIERRVKEHNSGSTISTKGRRPLELIYYEAFLNRDDALRREDYFKTTKGKRTLRLMLREYIKTSNYSHYHDGEDLFYR